MQQTGPVAARHLQETVHRALERTGFVAVTAQLRAWFEADPSRTGRELLARLQVEYPDSYPDRLLRTVQRRLKLWRSEMARALVFGSAEPPRPDPMPSAAIARA